MKHVIVTGGAGFIGSHLCDSLLKIGYDVIVVDNLCLGYEKNVPLSCIRFLGTGVGDICDYNTLCTQVITSDIDVVFHVAAVPRVQYSIQNPMPTHCSNINGTFNMLMVCKNAGIKRFVYSSSSSVYGEQDVLPLNEKMTPNPLSPYALHKLVGEYYCKLFCDLYGMETISLRYFNCYDKNTEILTKDGFKYLKDVSCQDFVATLNPKTKEVEYHHPEKYFKIPHKGKMVQFKSKYLDMLVTEDNNMYVGKDDNFELMTVSNIFNNNRWDLEILQDFRFKGLDTQYETIPEIANEYPDTRVRLSNKEKKIPIIDWLEFLGWFLSEGSITSGKACSYGKSHKYYRVVISQKPGKYLEEIKNIVKKIGFNYCLTTNYNKKESTVDVCIHSKSLYEHLKQFKNNKHIPRNILDLEPELLKILFTSLMKGDGDKNRLRYTTKYKQFADNFQELCFKIGFSARLRIERDKRHNVHYFRINFNKTLKKRIGRRDTRKCHFTKIDYDDFVYDITVKNHIIFLRRNGFCFWSGNCFGPRQDPTSNYSCLIPKSIYRLIQDQSPVIYGDGENTRDFNYVSDVVDANIKAAETTNQAIFGKVINIGSGESYSVNNIISMLKDISCKSIETIYTTPVIEAKHTKADNTLAKQLLKWEPRVSILEGLFRTYEYFKRKTHG